MPSPGPDTVLHCGYKTALISEKRRSPLSGLVSFIVPPIEGFLLPKAVRSWFHSKNHLSLHDVLICLLLIKIILNDALSRRLSQDR